MSKLMTPAKNQTGRWITVFLSASIIATMAGLGIFTNGNDYDPFSWSMAIMGFAGVIGFETVVGILVPGLQGIAAAPVWPIAWLFRMSILFAKYWIYGAPAKDDVNLRGVSSTHKSSLQDMLDKIDN